MGVRVMTRIRYRGASTDVVALVNTGYETDVPEILIPVETGERLGIWPGLPEGTITESYRTASGLMRVYRIRGAEVSLLEKEVELKTTNAYIVISEYTDEALLSDRLVSELGIVIEDPAEGLWRLRGETSLRRGVRR